jgi:hypothetical protein
LQSDCWDVVFAEVAVDEVLLDGVVAEGEAATDTGAEVFWLPTGLAGAKPTSL